MGKTTKPIAGQSQRKYFRDLFKCDSGVTPEAAARLTETCCSEIAQIRVRLPLVVRRPLKLGGASMALEAAKGAVKSGKAEPVKTASVDAAPAATFDPHAFSLIVILRKSGKRGLLAKLAEVSDVAHLRAIANAQHVSLDAALSDRAAICEAIVAGTERRIAHRQAAAS